MNTSLLFKSNEIYCIYTHADRMTTLTRSKHFYCGCFEQTISGGKKRTIPSISNSKEEEEIKREREKQTAITVESRKLYMIKYI